MAELNTGFSGITLELNNEETKELLIVTGIAAATAYLASKFVKISPRDKILLEIFGAYIAFHTAWINGMNKGNGVKITAPWGVIALGPAGTWWSLFATPR